MPEQTQADPTLPLAGMTVIELGQIYNGPYCGLLLGFLGARVIKVEPPTGDVLRARARSDEDPVPYLMLNSNKESVVIDLKDQAGKDGSARPDRLPRPGPDLGIVARQLRSPPPESQLHPPGRSWFVCGLSRLGHRTRSSMTSAHGHGDPLTETRWIK